MLTWRGVLSGCGAVLALYLVVFLYKTYGLSRRQTATGLGALMGSATEVLMHPGFWLAAVAVFLAAAF